MIRLFLSKAYSHHWVLAFSPFKRYKPLFYNYIGNGDKCNVLIIRTFNVCVVPYFFSSFVIVQYQLE